MRILIAEDDLTTRTLVERFLVILGHEVVVCADGSEALLALAQPNAPRLVILDWMMPGVDGLEVCRQLRARSGPYTYIFFISSKSGLDDLEEGFAAGADDYLVKPPDLADLRRRLLVAERILAYEQTITRFAAQMEHLAEERARQLVVAEADANTDALTGVWNRRHFADEALREISRATRHGHLLHMLMLDIDHFKQVNDRWGHLAGDEVLLTLSRVARENVRRHDSVVRWGGEEFIILVPHCTPAGAAKLAEKLRNVIEGTTMPHGVGTITISIGVAGWRSGDTPNAWLERADAALYQAKEQGRNRVVIAAP